MAGVGVIIGVIAALITVAVSSSSDSPCDPTKIIIDTDGGVDDAFAIFYLLNAEKISKEGCGPKIVGITSVNGNTGSTNVTINVLRMLNLVNRTDIPVYKGAEGGLLLTPPYEHYFGTDGFGDVFTTLPTNMDIIKPEPAVLGLLNIVNNNIGEITIIALGPLTNIAMAERIEPGFVSKLKTLHIMGGSVEGRGNMAPGAEFNTLWDPEAAQIIFNDTNYGNTPVNLVPWESTLLAKMDYAMFQNFRKNELRQLNCPQMDFLDSIEHIETLPDTNPWYPCDLIAAAVFIDPNIITRMESYAILVNCDLKGPLRGVSSVDYVNNLNAREKINIVYRIDNDLFRKSLIKYFTNCYL